MDVIPIVDGNILAPMPIKGRSGIRDAGIRNA